MTTTSSPLLKVKCSTLGPASAPAATGNAASNVNASSRVFGTSRLQIRFVQDQPPAITSSHGRCLGSNAASRFGTAVKTQRPRVVSPERGYFPEPPEDGVAEPKLKSVAV